MPADQESASSACAQWKPEKLNYVKEKMECISCTLTPGPETDVHLQGLLSSGGFSLVIQVKGRAEVAARHGE